MSKRDNSVLIQDMLESAVKIIKYTEGLSFDQFEADDKTVDAVIRNFEIIGEAANRIESDFKILNPQIEWTKMRGFRNRIVHDYFGIDLEIVWSIIQGDIEELIYQLEQLS
ncbi:DUF86 domain-containing protein [uncultured Roseivirga sp.]|uniref:HepT-like ribonuclease domain-containing protein n=1 Tax=uncultured Roseivirga sp. TaxID=543088 RepID=UPI0030DD6948|tara:strand:+ start:256 stop:588 length:333 start_codon:yes stop_codon:yes gene_type:complete